MPAKKSAPKTMGKKKVVAKVSKKTTETKVKSLTALKEPFNKTQLLNELADRTGLNKKQISAFFDNLSDIIEQHVKPRSVGEFTIPGLVKIKVVKKPATKARKGVNPFTGEETMFKAKPARNVLKIKALKKLKDKVAV